MKNFVSVLFVVFFAFTASAGINVSKVAKSTAQLTHRAGNEQIKGMAKATEAPYDMYVEPGTTTCLVTWNDDYNSAWNLRYRKYEPDVAQSFVWDFEDLNFDGWSVVDADGDGNGWGYDNSGNYSHGGDVALISASYSNYNSLNPDNWLISPKVPLNGTLTLWAGQRSSNYPDNFAIYVCVGDFTSTDDFVKISDDYAPTTWTEYSFDLSEYDSQEGYFAIRHYNSYDQWALLIDDISLETSGAANEWIYANNLDKMAYTIEGLEMDTEYEVQVQAIGDDGTVSEWTRPDNFITLAEEPFVTVVHILGEIDDQIWNPSSGTKMDYDAETELYTATFFIWEDRTFGFSTEIDDNGDMGGWNYLIPFRFGPVSEDGSNILLTNDVLGQRLPLTFDNYGDIQALTAGEYQVTLSLEENYVIIGKISEPPHGYQAGDVNHDLKVTIEDVTILIDYLLGTENGICTICADFSGNGEVTIEDVTAMIDYLLGVE